MYQVSLKYFTKTVGNKGARFKKESVTLQKKVIDHLCIPVKYFLFCSQDIDLIA